VRLDSDRSADPRRPACLTQQAAAAHPGQGLPWRQVPAGSTTRDSGHGRAETRTLKVAHVSGLDFPGARQAIKITRWRQDTATGQPSRQTAHAVSSLTSADAAGADLARLVREQGSSRRVTASGT
jgi:hypothetical protein